MLADKLLDPLIKSGIDLLIDGQLNALDLQDLVSELRNAGAEAVAVGDHRLVADSVFVVGDGGRVTIDGQPVQRPYRLQVIGDPETVETALLRPGGLISLFYRTHANLSVQVTRQTHLVLGVHRPHLAFRFAQSVE